MTVDEAETSQKPPSRARRASSRADSAPASKSRTSTRGKPSLPDVAESQAEEESDAQPARKRSRPSDEGLQEVNSDWNEEQEEVKLVSGKKAQPPKRQTESTGAKARTSNLPSSGAAPPTSSRSKRSRKGKEVQEPAHEEEQGDDEEEVERLAIQRPGRAAQKRNSIPDEELSAAASSDENEKEFKPTTKRRNPTGRKVSGKQRKSKREATPQEAEHAVSQHEESANRQDSDMDDDIPDFKPKPSPRKPRQSTREPVLEEEEEKSLFEPPSMPPPPSTAPPPEEPSGPKSRLMIHKMALVNFKSYAGRQVIGPFHKVCMYKPILDFLL